MVYIAVAIALWRTNKAKFQAKSAKAINLLLWLSLPLILTFWFISLFNATLPHWTGPAFIPLFLLAGVYWASYSRKFIPVILQFAMGFMLVLMVGYISLVKFYPQQLGSQKLENLGEYNPINDVTGWVYLSEEFKKIALKD